jgi:hypothetical protein
MRDEPKVLHHHMDAGGFAAIVEHGIFQAADMRFRGVDGAEGDRVDRAGTAGSCLGKTTYESLKPRVRDSTAI